MISVVIPLGPCENWPEALLAQLQASPLVKQIVLSCHANLILSDHWPDSKTRLYKCEFSRRGSHRAEQLNLGFSIARGEWIWFVHADTILDESCFVRLRETMIAGKPGVYFFDLAFHDLKTWPLRLTTIGVAVRSGWLKLPFGDQTFFVDRKTFIELQGFPEGLAFGEDHAFVWQAHLSRIPVMKLNSRISTSARKYKNNGWLSTTRDHLFKTVEQAWPFFLQYLNENMSQQRKSGRIGSDR